MEASEKRIDDVLQRMRCCIDRGNITFVDPSTKQERPKNLVFLQTYNIESKGRLKVLKSLTTKHFCGEILDRIKDNPAYEETMYVFGKRIVLETRIDRKRQSVLIYIKIQFLTLTNGNDATLIISFHKAEEELQYMFKRR